MSRNAAPSVVQMEKLISIMEEKRWLATGHARTTHARDRTRAAWKEAALKLNCDGSGCIKSWQQWAKYWKDKKAAIKKKALLIRMAPIRPVGDEDEPIVLTKFEERVVALMSGGGSTSGNRGLQVNAFSPPVNGHCSVVGVVEMAEESEPNAFNIHPGPSWQRNIVDNQLNAEQQNQSRIPPISAMQSARDDPSSSLSEHRRRLLMGRRRLIRRSQLQRRALISDLAERLMALEERNLDIEKSQAEIRRIEAETLRLQAVNQQETIDIFRQISKSFQDLVEHIVKK
ncbi:unnamed protein product [Diatraea saccharalis]|uniref:Uncharacterized protein n=1 Tax=Diatraea saccharalis TaxID=40085 RepID=A0A9N9QV95_9NEOP|nr:unnamed protein product [Diatraea saccharalis]